MPFLSLFLIIQARMTSTRLKGKVMLPLCEYGVLETLLLRLERFKGNIIVATTNDGSELPIVELCTQMGIRLFQGSTENVLERYTLSAQHFGAISGDSIIRITSDCPFADPNIIEALIQLHYSHDLEYCYADIHHSFPRGFDCEIFTFDTLLDAYHNATDHYEREHVTPYIRAKSSLLYPLNDTEDNSHYRLTLDTQEDYDFLTALCPHIHDPIQITYHEIMDILHTHPHLSTINAHVNQKHS